MSVIFPEGKNADNMTIGFAQLGTSAFHYYPEPTLSDAVKMPFMVEYMTS